MNLKYTPNQLYNKFTLVCVFIGRINGVLYENDIVFMTLIALCAFGILLNIKIIFTKLRRYVFWSTGFLSLYILSAIWALDSDVVMVNWLATLGRTILMLFIISNLVEAENRNKVIRLFMTCVVLNYLSFLAIYGIQGLTNVRSEDIGQASGWNNNLIGMTCAYSIVLMTWLPKGKRKELEPLRFLIVAFLLVIVFLSGSKKALLIIPCYYGTMALLNRKNKIGICIGVSCCIISLYYLIISVPVLYGLIGYRLQSLILGLLSLKGTSTTALMYSSLNSSDRLRMYMIIRGIEWFKERPLGGYGMANFQVLLGTTNMISMYAHNNYIEIAVGMGILGIFAYYSIYYDIFICCLKNMKKNESMKRAFAIILLILVLDIGFVSYLEISTQFMLALAFCATRKEDCQNFAAKINLLPSRRYPVKMQSLYSGR